MLAPIHQSRKASVVIQSRCPQRSLFFISFSLWETVRQRLNFIFYSFRFKLCSQTPTTVPPLPPSIKPETSLPPRCRNDQNERLSHPHLLSFDSREPAGVFFFFKLCRQWTSHSFLQSCREVIRQHSISGGRSVCLLAHVMADQAEEVSVRRMATL